MVRKAASAQMSRTYQRFSLSQRVEHIVMLLSFTVLAVTGLPQKFAANGFSIFLVRLFGGIENLRIVHHVAAILLMLSAVYHLITIGYKVFVLRVRMSMLPTMTDIKDAWQTVIYNLGLGKSRPQMGRYTFDEKVEYWALVWGTIIMALTGFLMWNPITSARLLPGEFIPAAKAAHGAEAVLAVLAIIIWHIYSVHIKHFNKSMFTGELTEKEMLHDHSLELADIKSGVATRLPEAATVKRRRTIYYPIAAVLGIAMLAGIYGFVGSEQTALTTVVEQRDTSGTIYDPQTPTPLPTSASVPLENMTGQAADWSIVAPIVEERCGMCHGDSATAGLAITDYASLMAGADSGPVIAPGDADGSLLIEKVKDGEHPGKLSPQELQAIKDWINDGAPE